MARVYASATQLNSATALMEVDTNTGGATISTTVKRNNIGSWRFNCTGSAKYIQHQYGSGTNSYFSVWVRFASFPNANAIILRLWDTANGQNIQVTSAGKLQFYDPSGVQQGSDTAALQLDTWYNIQLSALEFGGFTGMEARLNGVTIGSVATNYTGDFIRFGCQSAVTMDMYMSDIIVNDTNGSSQNSWPSSTSMLAVLRPNAAGDSNTFEKSGGAAGDANNYQDVDEVTPDGGTTFLARDTGVSNQAKDLYNVDSSAVAGIGASDPIVCVMVGGRVGSDSATSNAGRNGNFGLKSGGTEAWSASIDWSIATYTTNADPVPRNYRSVNYVDPSDSQPWTPAKLDALQIGARANSSATTVLRVSTVWALVEFEPRSIGKIFQPKQAVNRASTY